MTHIWNKPGMPQKGWLCREIEELEEATHTCEMCSKTNIRFVHHLTHPEGRSAAVGCECAGHLTNDYAGQREMNKQAQLARNRRIHRERKLEKEKQEWFANHSWRDYGDIKIKSGPVFRAGIIKWDCGTWRYGFEVRYRDEEVFSSNTMFEENAYKEIDNFIRSFSI